MRKTLRRTKTGAAVVARQLREAGHSNISIKKITAVDWAIIWQPKPVPERFQKK